MRHVKGKGLPEGLLIHTHIQSTANIHMLRYVRAKRERDRVLLERARSSPGSSRNLTPQRSAASTPPRAYSPVSSRPRSAERGGLGMRGGAGGGYSPTSRCVGTRIYVCVYTCDYVWGSPHDYV